MVNALEPLDPILVAAFEGWNDAGDASSDCIAHLCELWDAEVTLELDPDDYYDFQVNRPSVSTDADGTQKTSWPTTQVLRATIPGGRPVFLLRGIEPSIRWRRFCREILDHAQSHGVRTIAVLGALLADVPHTRPIPVTTFSSDGEIQAKIAADASTYEGPTGIVAVLQTEAQSAGFHSISIWAAIPHYVAQPPVPKGTLALLGKVEELLGVPIPQAELAEDARAWQLGADTLAAEDTEILGYIRQLEEVKDTAELPEASGDAIAEEFLRYLRRRDTGRG